MKHLSAVASGLIFGLGLLLSGMTDPAKVKGFLDLAGRWDPSLALVMGAAVAVGIAAFAIARRRSHAWSGDPMDWPTRSQIDRPLVTGGLLFGIGWGIAGFCPGPALVAMSAGLPEAAIFVAAMAAGMVLHGRWPLR
jgi:uncharacterized protein